MNKLDFIAKVEEKVRQQLAARRVGFLLGAGSSHLDGKGYPLASQIWDCIKDAIPEPYRGEIQSKLDEGADGIEQALDLLDQGHIDETPHRHSVVEAIASHFASLSPPTDHHVSFLNGISKRQETAIPLFNLNYDPLIERASEFSRIRFVDGFIGAEHAFFDSSCFQERIGLIRRSYRSPLFQPINGIIYLFKLHGSLGWYESKELGPKRCAFSMLPPAGSKRLMIPPQWRKASETMTTPYAALWSELRGMLRQGPNLINRLVSIGYSMRDEHVNAVLENGLVRKDFTLLLFSKVLPEQVFSRWSVKRNVIIVTQDKCSLYGEVGPGHSTMWSFEQLSKEV